MKRTLTYISGVLLLITALCISCQKEQNSLEEKGAPANEVVIRATISDAATKVSFTEDATNNKLKTAWETDDRIVGWDAAGNAIELKIASIENNTAIFTPVTGSAAIPTSGKVYMIYAPGKSKADISSSSLEYDLSNQDSGKLPALMTATGEVSNNVLALNFTNRLAIVAVKNPTFQVTEATTITGLQLSGGNILTKATFSVDGGILKMESSVGGTITRACNFTTAANGTTSETMVYFAVLPNNTAADVTVSTTAPTGYQISFPSKSFAAGQCYMLTQSEINKQTFTVTVANGITNGTITTNPTSGSSVAWGETVTVTANPTTGYELATLTYNDGSDHDIKAVGTFTMPQKDVTVSGSFQKKDFAITPTGTGSGTYTVTGGTYTVKKSSTAVTKAQMGDVIKVTPTPAGGYSGGTVTVTETTSGNNVTVTGNTFTMPAADVTITVTFTHVLYSINSDVTPASSGTVTFKKSGSEDGITQAYYGDEITVTDTPNTDYELVSIKWKEVGGSDTDITLTKKFTMPAKNVTVTVTFKEKLTGTINGHAYVKMGGKKWATTNIGATNPEEYGHLYSWGETETKSDYSSAKYKASSISSDLSPTSGNDVARVNWGSSWRMPTSQEFKDLADACGGSSSFNTSKNPGKNTSVGQGIYWCSNYGGVAGCLFCDGTNKLFFPAAGRSSGASLNARGSAGFYWSSTRDSGNTDRAYNLRFDFNDGVSPQGFGVRFNGFSVRPVSN